MLSKRKKFLLSLQQAINNNPIPSGTADGHDAGDAIGLHIDTTDALIEELIEDELIERTGLGCDIGLTARGKRAITDPDFI